MPAHTISQINYTGHIVSSGHFSGNAIYTRNTVDGQPDPNFIEAVTALDMQTLRYPAGQPDVAYANGLIVDGQLPKSLTSFLESARENGFSVVLVTPTVEGYNGPAEIKQFVRLAMEQYGDLIHAFEVGNEYWNHQDEYSYGVIANESAIAISVALEECGQDADIWVQMGDAGGRASAFNSQDLGSWITRNMDANNAILDLLSDEARESIDGVVEHYYFRLAEQYLGDLSDADQLIGLDYQIWQNALGEDISLNITEWNIRTTNYFQLGMRAASTMVAQFEFLLNLEVDEMYVWPPQHNSSSDLAGPDRILTDPVTGLVINTVGGAVFDLMSSSLVGMESVATAQTGSTPLVRSHVYANSDQVVVYVTSRSNNVEQVSFSLGHFWSGADLTSAIQVGYDPLSSDGRYFNFTTRQWDTAETIQVSGEDYVLNEHDVHARVVSHNPNSITIGGNILFELLPYEIIELTFALPDVILVSGTSSADRIFGTDQSEQFFGFEGDDVITGGAAADTLDGGAGDDFLNTGAGADIALGGQGADTILGWGGSDTLRGGDGNDRVDGWFGDDVLQGEQGDDTLLGGSGDDLLDGGIGEDSIDGGPGADTMRGGDGNDFVYGGEGADIVMGNKGDDTVHGDDGDDTVSGSWGQDRLYGGGGNDEMWGGPDDDMMSGGWGNDIMGGSEGNDTMYGDEGNDVVWGGSQHDVLFGNDGADTVGGFWGDDIVHGDDGDDFVWGNFGDDTLYGDNGNDLIGGAEGHDFLDGGNGDDTLWGGDGNDELTGGNNDDHLRGGAGDDWMVGGLGNDTFQFTFNQRGSDRIADFDPRWDIIQFDHGPRSFQEFQMYQLGEDVMIQLQIGNVTLLETDLSALSEDQFLFG